MRARTALLPLPLLALAFAVALPAAAQHDHGAAGSGVAIVPEGFAYAGALAGFSVLDLGDDDVPDYHQQNHLRVTQGGTVLFETTPDSGHDYDGVARFALAFPAAGPFAVEALDDAGTVLARHDGEALPASNRTATLTVTHAAAPDGSGTVAFHYGVTLDGTTVPSRIQVEVMAGDRLLARLATVGGDHALELAFDTPATHHFRFLATPLAVPFAPTVTAFDLGGLLPSTAVSPTAPALPPSALPSNSVVRGAAGNVTLLGTYDPWTAVGPDTRLRLAAVGPAGPIGARLVDGAGRVLLATEQLAGPVAEVATSRLPGTYTLTYTAAGATVDLPWTVLPPSDPTAAGPQDLRMEAPEAVGGVPFDLRLEARDAAGRPFDHTEVDLELARASLPVLQAKLHTHGDGDFLLRLALPAGDAKATAQVYPLEARAATPRAPLAAAFTVAEGPAPQAPAASADSGTEVAPAPLAVAAVALAAGARRFLPSGKRF